jgi:hypothetical protein
LAGELAGRQLLKNPSGSSGRNPIFLAAAAGR